MSPTEKVSFFSKGKKVVFQVATKGARRASAYAQKQVGYKPTPSQRKAAAERTEKGRYRSYKTPAQRKAATKAAASKKVTFDYLLCPVGNCQAYFKTKNAMLGHIRTAHPKYWQRIRYIRAKAK